jgi:hypothetical protein
MKTHTIIYGVNYSTEQVVINFDDKMVYCLVFCIETQLDKDCECFDEVFDAELDYQVFKDYHNSFIKKSK